MMTRVDPTATDGDAGDVTGSPVDPRPGAYFTVGPGSESSAAPVTGSARAWRVFASHTAELAEHPAGRSFVDAARSAVARAGHVAVEMASWTASDAPPADACVEQVRSCDVYVGVLGYRYGSPVRDDPARSYTELEFDTATGLGVPRLVFVLADQLDIPTPPAAFFIDAEHGARQREFRARVDEAGITRVRVTGPDHLELTLYQALVELRRRLELVEAARRRPPAPAGPRRSAYWAQVRDIAPARLLDRESELAELCAFAAGVEPCVWWQAPPWAGKTALLSTFALRPPPDVDVLCFFVTARLAGQSDSTAFTESMIAQLSSLLGESTPPADPAMREPHRRDLLVRAAERAQTAGRGLLLVLDGVDEDRGPAAGLASILSLLPRHPVPGLRVVLAGRPHPPVPGDVPADHPIRSCRIRQLTPSPAATMVEEAARAELGALVRAPGLSREVVGLLAAAGGGLALHDLHELTGEPPAAVRHLVEDVAGRTLRSRAQPRAAAAEPAAGYLLGHETLQVEALRELGETLVGAYRDRIRAWADGYRERRWPDPTPSYLLTGYQRMLRAAGDVEQQLACATDGARHHRQWIETGGDAEALAEIRAAQDTVLAHRPPDLVALCRLAIARRRLADRNANLPPELPALWARLGQPIRAGALAGSITSPPRRTDALVRVVEALHDTEHARQVPDVVDQARQSAERITTAHLRCEALVRLLRVLDATGRRDLAGPVAAAAGRAVLAVTEPAQRAQALDGLVVVLGRVGAAGPARRLAGEIADVDRRDRALAEVVGALVQAGDLEQAVAVAEDISERGRDGPLERLVAALAVAGRPDAATRAARRITDWYRGDAAFQSIAVGLARTGDVTGAVAAAAGTGDPESRDAALNAVALVLTRAGDLTAARRVAVGIEHRRRRAATLHKIVEWACEFDPVPALLPIIAEITERQDLVDAVCAALTRIADPAEVRQALRLAATAAAGLTNRVDRAVATTELATAATAAGAARDLPELARQAVAAASGVAPPLVRAAMLTRSVRPLLAAGLAAEAAAAARRAVETARSCADDHPPLLELLTDAFPPAVGLEAGRSHRGADGLGPSGPLGSRSDLLDLVPALVEALGAAGDGAGARRAAADLAAPRDEVRLLVRLARLLHAAGDGPGARETADRARAAADSVRDPADRLSALAELAALLVELGDHAGVRDLGRQLGPATRVLAAHYADGTTAPLEELVRALAAAGDPDAARDLAAEVEDPSWRVRALQTVTGALAADPDQVELTRGLIRLAANEVRDPIARLELVAQHLPAPGPDREAALDGLVRRAHEAAVAVPDRQGELLDPATALVAAGEHERARRLLAGITDPNRRTRAMAGLAARQVDAGAPEEARRSGREAHLAAAGVVDGRRRATALTTAARAMLAARDPDGAGRCAEAITDPRRRVALLLEIATEVVRRRDGDRARGLAQRVWETAAEISNPGWRAEALLCAAAAAGSAGDPDLGRRSAEQAVRLALDVDDPALRAVLLARALAPLAAGGGRFGLIGERALITADDVGSPSRRTDVLVGLVGTLTGLGLPDLAERAAVGARTAVAAVSNPVRRSELQCALARTGAIPPIPVAESALASAEAVGNRRQRAAALVRVAQTLATLAAVDAATAVVGRARETAAGISSASRRAQVLSRVAQTLATCADHQAARDVVEEVRELADGPVDPGQRSRVRSALVHALAAVGDVDEAVGIALDIADPALGIRALCRLVGPLSGRDPERAREIATRAAAAATDLAAIGATGAELGMVATALVRTGLRRAAVDLLAIGLVGDDEWWVHLAVLARADRPTALAVAGAVADELVPADL
jgi:hypothetical protein